MAKYSKIFLSNECTNLTAEKTDLALPEHWHRYRRMVADPWYRTANFAPFQKYNFPAEKYI